MIEKCNEIDTGCQTIVRLGTELITPSRNKKQMDIGPRTEQATTSPTKKKKTKV